jgi:hypothetical protein
LTPVAELNNVGLDNDEIILRTPYVMKNAVARDIAKQFSLHSIENVFWKHRCVLLFDTCNLYKST